MSQYIELSFDSMQHATASAILFDFGEEKPVWIPVSMIDMEAFDPDEEKAVWIKEWFALKEGLI